MPKFGSGEYLLPQVAELDKAALMTHFGHASGKDSILLAKSILAMTEFEFENTREINDDALLLARPTYQNISIDAEPIADKHYFRCRLGPLDASVTGNTFNLVNENNIVIGKIHFTGKDNSFISIVAYARLIIETSAHVQGIQVISTEEVMIGKNLDTDQLFIQAQTINTELDSQIYLSDKQCCLYAYEKCELNGVIQSDGAVIVKAGSYVGHADIYANKVAIISESGNQYAKILAESTISSVGLNWHNHPGSHIHAPRVQIIVPEFIDEGIIATADFSLLHYTATWGGHYYFSKITRIDTNHAIKATKTAILRFNGYFEGLSNFSARFAGRIYYCPNMSITRTEVNIGSDPELYTTPAKLPETTKRGMHLQSGMNIELSGKVDLKEASLTVKSGHWVKVLAEIQAFSANDDCVLHFQGKDITLAENVTSNATVVVSGAEHLELGETTKIEARNLYIDAPACDIQIEQDNVIDVERNMIVNARSFHNRGYIKGDTLGIEASEYVYNTDGGKINVKKQQYVTPIFYSSTGLVYKELMTTAYVSYVGGFNITGTTTHLGLITCSTHLNIQKYLTLPGLFSLGLGAANLILLGLYPIAPGVVVPAQIFLNLGVRGAAVAANFSSLLDSTSQVYKFPSPTNKVKWIGRLTQMGIMLAGTAMSAVGSYKAMTSASSSTPLPTPDLRSILKSGLPYFLASLTGSTSYSIVNVTAGGTLGISQANYCVFNFDISAFAGLTSASTSFYNYNRSAKLVVFYDSETAYFQIMAGVTKSLFGSTNIQAHTTVFESPYFEHSNMNIHSNRIIVEGGRTTIAQSTLSGSELDVQTLLVLDHSQVNSTINAHADMELINNSHTSNQIIVDGGTTTISQSTLDGPELDVQSPVVIDHSQVNSTINAHADMELINHSHTSNRIIVNGGTTTITQSTLDGPELDVQTPLVVDQSEVNSTINAHANMELINSHTQGNMNLDPGVSVRTDGGTATIPVLTLGEGAITDFDLSQVATGTTVNHGVVTTNDSSFTVEHLDQQGQFNLTNSLVSIGQSTGNMSSSAVHTDHTQIYTTDQGNTYDANQKKGMDELMAYCALHHCYPTAEQWYALFNHTPTKQEVDAYNNTAGSTFTRDRNYKPLSAQEYTDFENHKPDIKSGYRGRTDPADLRMVNSFESKLLAGKSLLPGASIVPHAATPENIEDFSGDKKDIELFYYDGILYYIYPDTINIANRRFYNIVPVGIYSRNMQLSGDLSSLDSVEMHASCDLSTNYLSFHSTAPVGLFAQRNLNMNHSNVTTQSGLTAYAGNKVNLTASHLQGGTTLVQGDHGVDIEPDVVTHTNKSTKPRWHGIFSGVEVVKTTTTTITPSSVTSTDGDTHILSPEGAIISHGTEFTSSGRTYFDGNEGVLLWDVRGTNSRSSHTYNIAGYQSDKTVNTISEPSQITTQSNVYTHSGAGNIDTTGTQIQAPNGDLYVDAPNGNATLSRPVLVHSEEKKQIGILNVMPPSPMAMTNAAAAALLTDNKPTGLTATVTVGTCTSTVMTESLGPGSVTAKAIHINADSVAIMNAYDLNADQLDVRANQFDYEGAQLHMTATYNQYSVDATVDLLTGKITNASFTYAGSTSNAIVNVDAQPNVGVWNLQVGTLNLRSANVDPAVLKGHADLVNIYSPIDSVRSNSTGLTVGAGLVPSQTSSTGYKVGSGSFSYSTSHARDESIAHVSILNPADATGFTPGTVNATDANVSSNIRSEQFNNNNQSLVNSSSSIGVGISSTPQGISSVQFNYATTHGGTSHSLNADIPVAIIGAALSAVYKSPYVQNYLHHQTVNEHVTDDPVDNEQNTNNSQMISTVETNDKPDDEYHDFENSDKPIASHAGSNTNDNTISNLQESMFKDSPSSSSSLFPMPGIANSNNNSNDPLSQSEKSLSGEIEAHMPFFDINNSGERQDDYLINVLIEAGKTTHKLAGKLEYFVEVDGSSLKYPATTALAKYVGKRVYLSFALVDFIFGNNNDVANKIPPNTAFLNNTIKQTCLFTTSEVFGLATLPLDVVAMSIKESKQAMTQTYNQTIEANNRNLSDDSKYGLLAKMGLFQYQANVVNSYGMNNVTNTATDLYQDFRECSFIRVD